MLNNRLCSADGWGQIIQSWMLGLPWYELLHYPWKHLNIGTTRSLVHYEAIMS